MEEYENLSDEQLIRSLREGDSQVMDYLMEKYKNLVRKKANALFLLGGDTDDLIQEGMLGLFKAVRDYEEDQGGFYPFAELCINRQLYTAIESAARKKHGPLNYYVSLSGGDSETEGTFLEDAAAANEGNPEQMLIDRESVEDFLTEIRKNLSPLERTVFDHYLDGMNYRTIAEKLGRTEKSIDNAIQRIRAKAQDLIDFYFPI